MAGSALPARPGGSLAESGVASSTTSPCVGMMACGPRRKTAAQQATRPAVSPRPRTSAIARAPPSPCPPSSRTHRPCRAQRRSRQLWPSVPHVRATLGAASMRCAPMQRAARRRRRSGSTCMRTPPDSSTRVAALRSPSTARRPSSPTRRRPCTWAATRCATRHTSCPSASR